MSSYNDYGTKLSQNINTMKKRKNDAIDKVKAINLKTNELKIKAQEAIERVKEKIKRANTIRKEAENKKGLFVAKETIEKIIMSADRHVESALQNAREAKNKALDADRSRENALEDLWLIEFNLNELEKHKRQDDKSKAKIAELKDKYSTSKQIRDDSREAMKLQQIEDDSRMAIALYEDELEQIEDDRKMANNLHRHGLKRYKGGKNTRNLKKKKTKSRKHKTKSRKHKTKSRKHKTKSRKHKANKIKKT